MPAKTTITLDRPRTFRLDVNALCALEEATGVSSRGALRLLADDSITTLVQTVAAALLHEEPDMTASRAQRLIRDYIAAGGSVKALQDAVAEAFQASKFFAVSAPPAKPSPARKRAGKGHGKG